MKADTPYLLSIIVPSYNRQDLLHQLITKIDQQDQEIDDSRVELIVVDDGSVKALKQPKQPIKVPVKWIRFEKNMGAPYARKVGFQHSSGQFIHFHDSDDNISETWLNRIIKYLINNKDLDFLITSRKVISERKTLIKKQVLLSKIASQPYKIQHRLLFENCLGPLGGLTFSRLAVSKMRFNNLPSCQDWDMYLDGINDTSQVHYDWNNSFIKNDTHKDQISKNVRKKLLGVFRLARIHRLYQNNKVTKRLFFIHQLPKKIRQEHRLLQKFYQKKLLKIVISFQFINMQKRLPPN